MPSLLEAVTGVLGAGDTYDKLGEIIGGDAAQTGEASDLAVPVILGGLAERASDDGPSALLEMLDRTDGVVLDDLEAYLDRGDPAPGMDLLDGIFGSDRAELTGWLASKAEMGGSMVTTLLAMLAPLVIDTVRRKRRDGSLDGDGVAALLAEEREALDRSGLLHPLGAAWNTGTAGEAGLAAVGGVATVLESRTEDRSEGGETPGRSLAGADRAAGADGADGPLGAPGVGDGALGVGDDVRGGFGWMGWAVGAVVLVLGLAWLLSRCNDDPVSTQASTTIVDVAGGSDDPVDDPGPTGSEDAGADAVAADVIAAPEVGTDSEDDEPAGGDELVGGRAVGSGTDDEDASDEIGPTAGETINELLDLDPVTFDIRSARITADGQAVLDQAGRFLEDNPDIRIEIGGHTDSDGSESNNLVLSQGRADAVKEYLVRFGIDAGRLEATGYGESEPLVPNDSSRAKAENRRIEFTIVADG